MTRESFLEVEVPRQELKCYGGWEGTEGMKKALLIRGWWEGEGKEARSAGVVIVEGLRWPCTGLRTVCCIGEPRPLSHPARASWRSGLPQTPGLPH